MFGNTIDYNCSIFYLYFVLNLLCCLCHERQFDLDINKMVIFELKHDSQTVPLQNKIKQMHPPPSFYDFFVATNRGMSK